jgi:hypothetical protein
VSFEVERDATTLNFKSRTPNLLFDNSATLLTLQDKDKCLVTFPTAAKKERERERWERGRGTCVAGRREIKVAERFGGLCGKTKRDTEFFILKFSSRVFPPSLCLLVCGS